VYKVMIVDDEPEIRRSIHLKVQWEDLHLTVAAESANGREALQQLQENDFQIVITDMNMPIMDGVSFLESCHQQFPHIRIIVITGYDEFEYARAAVRHQAKDFLLKPIKPRELARILEKLVQELDQERRLQAQQETVNWKLSQYGKELKEHFILEVIKENWENERYFLDRFKLFQLEDWTRKEVRLITVGLRDKSEAIRREDQTPDKLRLPFELLCREFAETSMMDSLVFHDSSHPLLMHFILGGDLAAVQKYMGQLQQCALRHLLFEPSFGIGEPVIGYREWGEGYISSLLAWSIRPYHVDRGDREARQTKAIVPNEMAKVLQNQLIRGELLSFEQSIDKELKRLMNESHVHFVKFIFQLYLILETVSKTLGVSLESHEKLWVRPELVWELNSVGKANGFLMGLARKIHGHLQAQPTDSDHTITQAAKQFIDENYMYDLNLQMLAERYHYSTSYFSELFKAKLGKTFSQYISEVRMAKAVQLLEETSMNLWDIAELTRYSNPSYFSTKFKRMYGISPSEYREKRSEKSEDGFPK
jgi:two-component system, response regulator YesN